MRHDRDRESVRQALKRSTGRDEPDVNHLVDTVPAMIAEAARRRRARDRQGAVTAVIPLAWKAIPRLATVAATLVMVSVAVVVSEPSTDADDAGDLDALILGEEIGSTAPDTLLEAIVGEEIEDG